MLATNIATSYVAHVPSKSIYIIGSVSLYM